VLGGDTVVEEVDDLVGDARGGLGAERQQRRMAKRLLAPADRLAAGVPDVLGEHPPPVGRDRLQIPVLGAQAAQQLELVDRLADTADRPRLLTELLDRRRGRAAGADKQQLVEVGLDGRGQHVLGAAVDLSLAVAAGAGDEPLEHRQPRTHHPFAA